MEEYANKLKQTQSVYSDEGERTDRVMKYVEEVPYLDDFETVSKQESAGTKHKRTEKEKEAYERQKEWADVSGGGAALSYKNQEQDLIDEYVMDDQLAVYNYLVNSGQQEYADEYWKRIKAVNQQQRNQDQIERVRDVLPEGWAHDALGTLISLPVNVGGTVQGAYYIAGQKMSGQDIDPQDAAFSGLRVRDALRQDASEDMPEWGKFLYQTGVSLGDSALSGILGGPTGGALLIGSSAAVDTVRDVKERGGTDKQALTAGVVAGSAEVLTEKAGFERLGKMFGGVKSEVVKELATHILSEGAEESATEIINILADALIMSDQSEYMQLIDHYMSQGMSKKDAHIQAILDKAGQVGLAGLGGTLSGGVMGGGAIAMGSAANVIEQRQRNYDVATNIFTEGARGGSAYENRQETTPQLASVEEADASSGSNAFLSEGEAEAEETDVERMAQEYGEDASVFKAYYEDGDPE